MTRGGKYNEKDVQSLTVTIDREIGEGAKKTKSLFSSACIYRVPEELRKLKESAYTPHLIAIGPLHRKDQHLDTPMQHVKLSYANKLFCRLTEGMDKHQAETFKFKVLKKCVVEMKKLIDDAKKCYAEEVQLDEQMMLVDGCFILELLYRFSLAHKEEEKTPTNEGDSGNSKRPLGGEELLKVAQPLEGEEHSEEEEPLEGGVVLKLGRPLREVEFIEEEKPLEGEEHSEEEEPFEGEQHSEGVLVLIARPLQRVEDFEEEGPSRGVEFIEEEKWSNGAARPLGGEERIEISKRQETEDPIFDSILTANNVQHDLLLLENQIPFFVLEKLFQLTVAQISKRTHNSLTYYVSLYFGNMMSPERNSIESHRETATCCSPSNLFLRVFGIQMNNCEEKEKEKEKEKGKENEKEKEKEKDDRSTNYYHILNKLHKDYLHRQERKKKGWRRFELMPSASNLDYAGVKFVSRTGSNLFNAKFSEPKGLFWWCHRARFEIPPLGIYDSTEAFLRNLIAFEQCCPEGSQYFTSYAYLMDMLVNSEKDVEVLEKAGVVHNYLGASEDATDLFNKLCKEIVLGEFFFADMCEKVTAYSKRCWPNNMAHVRRKYFASPWTFIAFCLAFIVFGTTITGFIFNFLK